MPKDLNNPTGPGDYIDAFFAADYRSISAAAYNNWILGDYYHRVAYYRNADLSQPTPAEIASAVNTWDNTLTKVERWRLRIHHESLIKRESSTSKVWMYYFSGIPKAADRSHLEALTTPGEFEFLGRSFSAARTTIINRVNLAFWQSMWPRDTIMDTVVSGWEAAMA